MSVYKGVRCTHISHHPVYNPSLRVLSQGLIGLEPYRAKDTQDKSAVHHMAEMLCHDY